MKPQNIIKLDNVCKYYQMGDSIVKALNGIDVEINKGDFIVIVGPSGSGKSTIMNMVGALASVTPAYQASKLKPADALRYE